MDRWASALEISSQKYSQWNAAQDSQALFIDNIGMLSSLYQFAHFAYVGGGFGKGLHNILEPLGFGIPVIFGNPRSASKFPEAAQSQLEGCGFAVCSFSELQECVTNLEQPQFYTKSAASAQRWVKANLGAADRILVHLTTSISSK
jgi:3-deoxy-D-manno-octulosonic-acid transferase